MKPHIFIHIHYLEIGGVETALIGLLHALDPQRVNVDLFLNEYRGEMMRYIPSWVNLLPEVPAYSVVERYIKQALWRGQVRVVMARLWAKVRFALYTWRKRPKDGSAIIGYVGSCVTPLLPSLPTQQEYDLAISFLTPHNIVRDKVRAKKKICWIHTDYSSIDVNAQLELPVWAAYDRIMGVSADAIRSFLTVFPSLRDKVMEMENILPEGLIKQRAVASVPTDMPPVAGQTCLLTVGRYSYPKKLEEIPTLCRRLLEQGDDVRWYIIGYGESDEYIRRAITDEGMQERVFLLGKRENPYPYLLQCDWYVQPSRYEGKSVVVREAQVLCRPCIVTAYPTAASQITDGVDGVIVPLAIDECARAMHQALNDHVLRHKITSYLSTHDYTYAEEVEKLYSLV